MNGNCPPKLALFLGCVFPWLIGWMFYQERVTGELLTWSGLVLDGLTGFILPLAVTLVSLGVGAALIRRCWREAPPAEKQLEYEMSPVKPLPRWLHPHYAWVATVLLVFFAGVISANIAAVLHGYAHATSGHGTSPHGGPPHPPRAARKVFDRFVTGHSKR